MTNRGLLAGISDPSGLIIPGSPNSEAAALPVGGTSRSENWSCAGASTSPVYDVGSYAWVAIQVVSQSGTVTVSFSNDGINWVNGILQLVSTAGGAGSPSSNAASLAMLHGPVYGRYMRLTTTNAGVYVTTFLTLARVMQGMGVAASQSGVWTVGSNSATGSATPANAFLGGMAAGTGNLSAFNTGSAAVDFASNTVLAVATYLFNGATFDRQRTPSIFKTATATASGDTALWTPTSGKKFRLLKYSIWITADAATAGGADIDIVLRDATTATAQAFSVFVPAAAATLLGPGAGTEWIDLGNGQLSAVANNVLNINLSAALTAGKVRVVCCGTEE